MDDLTATLRDVRRAYRLINEYHRRLIDTFRKLQDELKAPPFSYWWSNGPMLQRGTSITALNRKHGFNALAPGQQFFMVHIDPDNQHEKGSWLLEIGHLAEPGFDFEDETDYPGNLDAEAESDQPMIRFSSMLLLQKSTVPGWKLWQDHCYWAMQYEDQEPIGPGACRWTGSVEGTAVAIVENDFQVAEISNSEGLAQVCRTHRTLVEEARKLT